MTVAELRYLLAELVDEHESVSDREVLIRVGVGRYESIPPGSVERITVGPLDAAIRPVVVIDLVTD